MTQGLAQTFKAALTQVDTTPFEPLGVIRYTDNGVFKYVKFSGTTANVAGDPVGYVLSDTSLQTVDGASATIGAGVAMAAITAGTVQYGWIQTSGVNAAVNGVTGSAGNELKMTGTKTLGAKAAAADASVGIIVVQGTPSIVQLIAGN